MLLVGMWWIWLSFGRMMGLDDLYTATLVDAPSLGHMWDGAIRGVDGNPPLYLSIAWALTHALDAAPDRVLRPFNLVLLAATAAVAYRIGRRLASPGAVAVTLALLLVADGMVGYALLAVRTYALYLFLVSATLLAALRVVDRPNPARAIALAGIGLLATLAHSFGGFYVLATLGAAGLACFAGRDRRAAAALGLAAVPSLTALLAWIAISFPFQKAVATPYGWIPVPNVDTLLEALTGSRPLTIALGIALALAAARLRFDPRRLIRERRDVAALYAALFSYAGLTLAAWLGSQLITPFFIQRYFIPNLLIAALLPLPAVEAARHGARPAALAGTAATCVLIGCWSLSLDVWQEEIPCLDTQGHFLEADAARVGLPVVAVSPHVWLPRARYAPNQKTLYPLDWRVVLDYPKRARNNAMDFHIMEVLRHWATPGSALAANVLSTNDILAQGRFLVLDEAGRGWFDALRRRHAVRATLMRESPDCRLWEVALGDPEGP